MVLNKEADPNNLPQSPVALLSPNMHTKSYMHTYACIYPTSPHRQDVTQGQFFKRSSTHLNLEFSFSETGCHTKIKGSTSLL